MRKKLLSLAVSFLMVFELLPLSIPAGRAMASEPGVTERQISASQGMQRFPSISGSKIVWQDERNGTADIRMYDLVSSKETMIATAADTETCEAGGVFLRPGVSKSAIVWTDYRNASFDGFSFQNTHIYAYSFGSGVAAQISTDTADQWDPYVLNNKVVYCDNRRGNNNIDIRIYNLDTKTDTQITSSSSEKRVPVMSEDGDGNYKIVWEDFRNGQSEIYMYDSKTNREFALFPGRWATGPAISGKYVVWEDLSASDFYSQVYLCDVSNPFSLTYAHTTGAYDHHNPAIYGNKLVWLDNRSNAANDVYYSNFTTSNEEKKMASPGGSANLGVSLYGENAVWYNISSSSEFSIRLASMDKQPPKTPVVKAALTTLPASQYVMLTWPNSVDTSTAVSEYLVTKSGDGKTWSPDESVKESQSISSNYRHNLTLSDQGKTWRYKVRAKDPFGNVSAYSAEAVVTVTDTIKPSSPSNLAVARSGSNLNLTWTASTDNVGPVRYKVEKSTNETSGWSQVTTATTSSYSDPAAANTRYYYRVRACDSATPPNLSDAFTNVANGIVDTLPPTVPSGVKVATASATDIAVSWGTSTDTGTGIDHYTVQWSTDKSTWTGKGLTGTKLTVGGLAANTVYYFRVYAVDKQGNASVSGIASARTFMRAVIQDNLSSPGLVWTTGWGTASNSSYDGGTTHFTTSANSAMEISFKGSNIYWMGTKAPSRGKADVYIDGVLQKTVDQYAATAAFKQVIFQKAGLSNGPHKLKIVAWGGATTDVDRIMIDGTCPGINLEETVASGTAWSPASSSVWPTESNAGHSGGTAKFSGTANSFIERTFTGTSITWIGRKGTNQGIAKVYIDGTLQGSIDTYAGSTAYQQLLYTKNGLSSGSHKLKIVVTGTARSGAISKRVYVDAFIVR